MSINVRLAYNQGSEYIDLFPRTSIDNIVDIENTIKFSSLIVNIPVIEDNITQIIPLNLTPQQNTALVDMVLISNDKQSKDSFNTITQFQIDNNQLIITRLYGFPTKDIEVQLYFKERKGV